jgi:hypothetical protein
MNVDIHASLIRFAWRLQRIKTNESDSYVVGPSLIYMRFPHFGRNQKSKKLVKAGAGVQKIDVKEKKEVIRDVKHKFNGCFPKYFYDACTGASLYREYYNVKADGTKGTLRARVHPGGEDEDEEGSEEEEG